MSSVSIFNSLRELFPQVDLRILRAISIEHEGDINEAIEFILLEVLPVANITPVASNIAHDTGNPEQELREIHEGDNGPEHITIPDDNPVSSFGMTHYISGAENQGFHSLVADDSNESASAKTHLVFLDEVSSTEPGHEDESIYNDSLSLNLNQFSDKEDENLLHEAHNQNDHFESLLDRGNEKIILIEHLTKFSEKLECANMALHVDTEELFQLRDEENISAQLDEQTNSSIVFDNSESPMEYGSLNLHDLETVVYAPPVLPRLPDVNEKDQHYQDSTTETYKDAIVNENHNLVSLDVNYLEISLDKNALPMSLATRSGHAVSTDILEDSINDAKNSKESLVSSLESMVSMIREVELLEGKAKVAKEDALVAGDHILTKVEELQQIVKKTMDENDMQSGQVYGERSILATEARELQSRLLRMSVERGNYLSVIEETFRALEVRQAAANDAIAVAELEKREKEELALKVLEDHELMRDALIAESQKLEQEAEENSKLREFLMDRGQVVDSLQGEIAIICEDILSLKQRVDSSIPFTKSLISSYLTKSLISSFSSSGGSSVHSSDHDSGSRSSTSRPATEKETHEKQQENTSISLDLLGSFSNPLDDWDLCEK